MSRGVISEQSSVREGAGYDEVYQTRQEPKEGHSWSPKRETSARSTNKDGENYIGEEDEEEIDEEKLMVRERLKMTGMKMAQKIGLWKWVHLFVHSSSNVDRQ